MTWHPTEIAVDGARPFTPRALNVGGRDLFVVPLDGAWYALEDRCSHAGCVFSEDAEVDGARIVCTCHGSEFDLRSGEPLRAPASRPVRTFPTRVVDGTLEIEL